MRITHLPAALIAALAMTLAPLPANGATDASALPEAESATLVAPKVGGLTPFLPAPCGVEVSFTDSTPSAPEAYLVRFAQGEQVGTYMGAAPDPEAPTNFEATIPCGELVDGATYDVAIMEDGQTGEVSVPFIYTVVGHPDSIWSTAHTVDGKDGYYPGRKVTISYPSGTWEPGTKFSTQIWLSKTPSFTDADFQANRYGDSQLALRLNSETQILTFSVPTWAEGMYAWYSVVGTKEGVAPYRFTFSALPIHNLPSMPKAWVKSLGKKKTGDPTVGRASKVSRVRYSATGSRKGLQTQYQWFVTNKNTAISGATGRSYVPAPTYRGYSNLQLRVRVMAKNRAPRTKWFSFGTI